MEYMLQYDCSINYINSDDNCIADAFLIYLTPLTIILVLSPMYSRFTQTLPSYKI